MIIAIVLALVSLLGLAIIFARHISEAVALSPNETQFRLTEHEGVLTRDVFGVFYERGSTYWNTTLRPQMITFLVKEVGWFRIFVLRMEQQLFKLANRIRSSSNLTPKPSEYWSGVHAWRSSEKSRGGASDSGEPPHVDAVHYDATTSGEPMIVSASLEVRPKRKGTLAASIALEHVEATLDEFHL